MRRTGQRPTAEETRKLVREYVDEQVLFLRAIELGLDKGDVIVRRRMVQKMEFALGGSAPPADPPVDVLQAWLDAHASQFVMPARVSFEQVFFSNARGAEQARLDAVALRATLPSSGPAPASGDPAASGPVVSGLAPREVATAFGSAFATALDALPVGVWQGPIASPHGQHLVRVTARTPARPARLEEVRAQVYDGWRNEQQTAARERALGSLRTLYRVQIDDPSLR
jgi:hypothetical protein